MSEQYLSYPLHHISQVLDAVQSKGNLLDIGSEQTTTFFDIYPEFTGDLVQVELNPRFVDARREKMNRLLPNIAATRASLLSTDLFAVGENT